MMWNTTKLLENHWSDHHCTSYRKNYTFYDMITVQQAHDWRFWRHVWHALALVTFVHSIVSLSGVKQCLKTWSSKPKVLPCPSPILFSRSDTSISTSMVSKSFEMHSLIINPVNEFFINPNEFLFLLVLSLFCHFTVTFPVTFWLILSISAGCWAGLGLGLCRIVYKSVSS